MTGAPPTMNAVLNPRCGRRPMPDAVNLEISAAVGLEAVT